MPSNPGQLYSSHDGLMPPGISNTENILYKLELFQTCICIWKNGKETVECINRDLGEIPEGIEPSTQVIDVRGNSIPVLMDDIFVDVSCWNTVHLLYYSSNILSDNTQLLKKCTQPLIFFLCQNFSL